mmetsp:Transcript_29827/g.36318  ORF Transcript_29827/g.36318 Transcript_29827/m.36318 type:complete len:262 (+) Transcript_29827:198-983(+)|eukprot:CAMPEP_0172518148 /NCGR_PEP_ID=MMETSP1066-20121228/290642_1 /TAXON_ID=671091 /ORGANISM="Coscinodiscus wailesii, Strain CCMP2513" /LENGTH=261 /DNA_ID=CAMNT_0013300477 /DNA_START=181 /DNA_END=966 /DNA_ORIENTATION=-
MSRTPLITEPHDDSIIVCGNITSEDVSYTLDEVIQYDYELVLSDANVDMEKLLTKLQGHILDEIADISGCKQNNRTELAQDFGLLSLEPYPSDRVDSSRVECIGDAKTFAHTACYPINGFLTSHIPSNADSVEFDILHSVKRVMENGDLLENFDLDAVLNIAFIGKPMRGGVSHSPMKPSDVTGQDQSNGNKPFYKSDKVTALGGIFMGALCTGFILVGARVMRKRKVRTKGHYNDERFGNDGSNHGSETSENGDIETSGY